MMATPAAAIPGTERHSFLRKWADSRAVTDRLFEIVQPQALYDRPIPERHRIVFYIGHLEAFDWNLLAPVLGLESRQPDLDRLFAFGIDPVGGGLPTDQPSDWPRMEEVRRYATGVRQALDARLNKHGLDVTDSVRLHVALEHRLMHAETLAYMFHQLALDRKVAQPGSRALAAPSVKPRMIEIPAGKATLGRPRPRPGEETAESFGWDNEFEAHTVDVPPFAIDAYNVTNGQFLDFMRAGGYGERSLWTEADWDWVRSEGVSHPRFWVEKAGHWHYRNMFAEEPLSLDWPAYVSQAEASAYARWVGRRLPTEAEFHRAAYDSPAGEREYPWGAEPPAERYGNFDFRHWNPVPVGSSPAGRSAAGVEDLVGNGWEWTSSVFEPFPGFQPYSFYPGYSANFFDGKHYVMKGGSSRTAACMLRRSFRNWFQPHYPFVYAAFRCVT
ncbi:MAG TPA: SUMF1/EgtB/PvdO family nonheme iron enzyme [Terriglobia bacterium]|nr:SUMF1/EgtB/PvdO family nonheme iron enzyme [Terriglobia bacterium]